MARERLLSKALRPDGERLRLFDRLARSCSGRQFGDAADRRALTANGGVIGRAG